MSNKIIKTAIMLYILIPKQVIKFATQKTLSFILHLQKIVMLRLLIGAMVVVRFAMKGVLLMADMETF